MEKVKGEPLEPDAVESVISLIVLILHLSLFASASAAFCLVF